MMINNQVGLDLHKKSTSGEKLTQEEQNQLNTWYASQDEEELLDLGLGLKEIENASINLHKEVKQRLKDIVDASGRMEKLTELNETLRAENEDMKAKLANIITRKSS